MWWHGGIRLHATWKRQTGRVHGGDGGDIGSEKSQHTIDTPTMSVAARDREEASCVLSALARVVVSQGQPGLESGTKRGENGELVHGQQDEIIDDGHPMSGDSQTRRRKSTK